jgi:hypothetical protein
VDEALKKNPARKCGILCYHAAMTPKKKKIVFLMVGMVVIILALAAVYQFIVVTRAHRTFENYYAFRGCVQLLEKTEAYGTCRTADGSTIKIVKYDDEWYLSGDLPNAW